LKLKIPEVTDQIIFQNIILQFKELIHKFNEIEIIALDLGEWIFGIYNLIMNIQFQEENKK
jgi:hypothetical protein